MDSNSSNAGNACDGARSDSDRGDRAVASFTVGVEQPMAVKASTTENKTTHGRDLDRTLDVQSWLTRKLCVFGMGQILSLTFADTSTGGEVLQAV